MRITQGMMMRKYGRQLNVNLGHMNKTSQQIESGRRFQRASEDPVRSLKALQVRRNLSALDQYATNIENAEAWLTQTEVAVSAIKTHADRAVDLVLQGKTDTTAPEDRMIIATALRNIQEALLKDLNSQIAGRYLLGGANTKSVPFTVHRGLDEVNDPDESKKGMLMFNIDRMDRIPDADENVFGVTSIDELESLETPVFVDLTGEFKLDEDGNIIDLSTVFNMFTPGVEVIGVGPYNLYNLIGRIAHSFESESLTRRVPVEHFVENPATGQIEQQIVFHTVRTDLNLMSDLDGPIRDANAFEDLRESEIDKISDIIERLGGFLASGLITQDVYEREEALLLEEIDRINLYYDLYWAPYASDGDGLFKKLQDAQLNALVSLVNVGERNNFVTYLKDRNEDYIFQAELMQNTLEAMPADEAIMIFKMQDYIYKASLQMGTYIFQPSLMDFIGR